MNIETWRSAVARWGKRSIALAATIILDVAVVGFTAPDWALAANIFLVLLTGESALFVGLYGARSNWRATTAGRAVMALVACIATICAVGTVGWVAGAYAGKAFVRVGAFIAIELTLTNLLLALVQVQNRERNQEES
jgi:hypothetical protein